MKYIVIKRVLKKNCPSGIKSAWSFDKIPDELWEVWDKKEVEEGITPDIYTDQMDETIENYSRNHPDYFWEWCIESKDVHFDILIDGNIYEGNEDFETAYNLFLTVDYSCLREYYGHTKTLQVTEGETTIKLTEAKIDKPVIGVRLLFADGRDICTWKTMFPEEAGSLLHQEYKGYGKPIKVQVLNRDMEVLLEF